MPATRATTKSTSAATPTSRKRQGSAADQTAKKRLRSASNKKASKEDLEEEEVEMGEGKEEGKEEEEEREGEEGEALAELEDEVVINKARHGGKKGKDIVLNKGSNKGYKFL